ncbi:MAG: CSLREA domain-containing protein [Dehalococcoidia bacterium]
MALFVAAVALAGLAGAGMSKTQAGVGTIFLVTKFDDTFDGFCDFDECSLRDAVA